jgi:hypothetical protein
MDVYTVIENHLRRCMLPAEADMKMEHIREFKFVWPNADVPCSLVPRYMTMLNRRMYVDIVARATERYRSLRDDGQDVVIVCYNLPDPHASHLSDACAALERFRARNGGRLHCAVLHAKDPSVRDNHSPQLLHAADADALRALCQRADRHQRSRTPSCDLHVLLRNACNTQWMHANRTVYIMAGDATLLDVCTYVIALFAANVRVAILDAHSGFLEGGATRERRARIMCDGIADQYVFYRFCDARTRCAAFDFLDALSSAEAPPRPQFAFRAGAASSALSSGPSFHGATAFAAPARASLPSESASAAASVPARASASSESEDEMCSIGTRALLQQQNGWECGWYSVFHYFVAVGREECSAAAYGAFIARLSVNEAVAELYSSKRELGTSNIHFILSAFAPEDCIVIEEQQLHKSIPIDTVTVSDIRRMLERRRPFCCLLCLARPAHWICLHVDGTHATIIDSLAIVRPEEQVVMSLTNLCTRCVPLPTPEYFRTVYSRMKCVGTPIDAFRSEALQRGFTMQTFCDLHEYVASREKKKPSAAAGEALEVL